MARRRACTFLRVVLALAAVGGACARALHQAPAAASPSPAAASSPAPSPRPPAYQQPADPTELHIVHINDVHNRIEPTSPGGSTCDKSANRELRSGTCVGGWARLTTAVRAARRHAASKNAGFLFLDIGDEFDGSLWDVVYEGAATAVMQNIARPDAMTLGNHEFSFKPQVLRNYINNLTFPMLGACNVDTSPEPLLKGLVKKWDIQQIGKYKVALVGWLSQETHYTAANAGNVVFNEVVPSVKQCIADLKKEHPDVHMIVGMSHDGYWRDIDTAKAIPELDMILGGHTHTFLNTPTNSGPIWDKTKGATPANCVEKRVCDEPTGPYPTWVNTKACTGPQNKCTDKKTPVFQAYYGSKYIGHLKFDLPSKRFISGEPILLGGPNSTSFWAGDPEINAAIRKLEAPVRALEKRATGKIMVTLVGGKHARTAESNFGDYLADVLVKTARELPNFKSHNGPVDIALINAGAIRADIEPEDVSYGEILTALPFLNTMAIKPLTGDEIKATMKHGLSGLADRDGRFLQLSGLRMWHRGDKLLDVQLLGPDGKSTPLDANAKYNIATLDYLANGGDGFEALDEAPSLFALGGRIDELMFNDLAAAMPNPIKVPDPEKERRIIDCDAKYVDCSNKELFGPCCPP